jgi:hypothetical protein
LSELRLGSKAVILVLYSIKLLILFKQYTIYTNIVVKRINLLYLSGDVSFIRDFKALVITSGGISLVL